jgi:hypothetical protein
VGGGWDVEARHPQHARYVVYLSAWHGHCGSSCTMLPRLVQHVSDGAVEAGEEADLLILHIKEAHIFFIGTPILFFTSLCSPLQGSLLFVFHPCSESENRKRWTALM